MSFWSGECAEVAARSRRVSTARKYAQKASAGMRGNERLNERLNNGTNREYSAYDQLKTEYC